MDPKINQDKFHDLMDALDDPNVSDEQYEEKRQELLNESGIEDDDHSDDE